MSEQATTVVKVYCCPELCRVPRLSYAETRRDGRCVLVDGG